MRERVTQSGRADLAHANRLKKALERGAPPSFVKLETAPRRPKAFVLNVPAQCLRWSRRKKINRALRSACNFWNRCFKHLRRIEYRG